MIVYLEKHIPLYQQLGVFTEAPNKPKRKPKVVNGGASGSLSDYTKDVESEEELDLNDLDMDDLEDGDTDDLTDGSDEELETDDPEEQEEPSNDEEDLTAGSDDDDAGGGGEDAPQTEDPQSSDEPATDEGEGGNDTAEADEPATDDGDGGDLTSGADDEDPDGGDSSDDSSDSGDDGEKKKFNKEDMKKYILFQNLMNLHTSLNNYVSKLNSVDANNNILGHAYHEVKGAFQELQSLIYDYMLLKFSEDSYTSAVYFYEQVKVAVLILFSILEEKKEELKKADGEGKVSSKKHFNR